MKSTSAVLDELGGSFRLTDLEMDEPNPGEVLIQVSGVGVCHTDLAVRDGHLPFPLPGVLGHEGSGIVLAVGEGVTKVQPGDRVCASFSSCGDCTQCAAGAPAYCLSFMERNFGGARADGTSAVSGGAGAVGSNFFGQSSFATLAMAHERNVVPVAEGLRLETLGPLGCGIQTGAGAVMNALACTEGSSLLVTGGGSVGLAALLGALVQNVKTIIVAEPLAKRRELASALGATHVIDPADGPIGEQVHAILPEGVNYAVDTTANVNVLNEVMASLAQRGHLGLLGVPSDPSATLSIGLLESAGRGISVTSIVEGNSDPDTFIPKLIQLHLEGRFPFDRLITTFPFSQINDAIEAQTRGQALKVVLVHG